MIASGRALIDRQTARRNSTSTGTRMGRSGIDRQPAGAPAETQQRTRDAEVRRPIASQ
jgi:hypothetical protein